MLPPDRQASSLELVLDTMTCLFQHLGSRAVPMLPFLGSILHMLNYSLPAILGPVGAAEDGPGDADDHELGINGPIVGHDSSGVDVVPKSGAQATATYYAAVQVSVGNKESKSFASFQKLLSTLHDSKRVFFFSLHCLTCASKPSFPVCVATSALK